MQNNMNRRKKNGLLILIYTILILLCFCIVVVVDELHSPTRPQKEQTAPLPEETLEAEPEEETEDKEEETEPSKKEEPESLREGKRPKPGLRPGEIPEESPKEEVYVPPTVVIASDVHYFSPELTDYGEAFKTMMAHDDGKVVNYISQLMDAFTADMERLCPSAVVFSGDLTLNGEKAGHKALAQKLRILEEKGVKVLVIPGNHDINNYFSASYFGEEKKAADIVDPEEFYEIYRQFGYDQAISRDQASLSYVYPLDEKNWLLMLDSAEYEPLNRVGGRIKEETLEWMKEVLSQAEKQKLTVIPIAHHNLLKESILYPEDCTLSNSREVIELLEAYQVPLYISGHLHLQRTKTYKPEPGEPEGVWHISEVVADSLAIPPCQYGILKWTEDGRLLYSTRETQVEKWAAQTGSTDENLLHFKEYGIRFLTEVISNQIYDQMSNLPREQMEQMARLYGDLNRAYCAGIPIDEAQIRTDDAYRLWERNLPDSHMFEEIQDILKDTRHDHNYYKSPPLKAE